MEERRLEENEDIMWIRVDEKLPEPYKTVLLWYKDVKYPHQNDGTQIITGSLLEDEWSISDEELEYHVHCGDVVITHWMELPNGPKKV